MDKESMEQIEANTIKAIVTFLNLRAEELMALGGVHIRESVALGEAAIMIERGMYKDYYNVEVNEPDNN